MPRNNDSAVPTGLETSLVTHNPSSELLGYYQTSLRDGRFVYNNEVYSLGAKLHCGKHAARTSTWNYAMPG